MYVLAGWADILSISATEGVWVPGPQALCSLLQGIPQPFDCVGLFPHHAAPGGCGPREGSRISSENEVGKDIQEKKVKDLGRPASSRPFPSWGSGTLGRVEVWKCCVAHSPADPGGRVTRRRVARSWETQEEKETQRAGRLEVDLNFKRQRRTGKQREGRARRTDRPVG